MADTGCAVCVEKLVNQAKPERHVSGGSLGDARGPPRDVPPRHRLIVRRGHPPRATENYTPYLGPTRLPRAAASCSLTLVECMRIRPLRVVAVCSPLSLSHCMRWQRAAERCERDRIEESDQSARAVHWKRQVCECRTLVGV